MGLLDKLKLGKKKQPEPTAPAVKQLEARPKKGDTGRAYRVLIRPVLSEKGTMLAGLGKYVFAVARDASKQEVKKSIEKVYNVHVEQVKIINMPSKQRRYGRSVGRTSAWKKAIVSVRAGEKIPGIIEAVG